MTGLELKVEDMHGDHLRHENEEDKIGYEQMMNCGEDDLLLGVSTDPSMFFAEFPALPDFSCMSSSSSSSSPPKWGQFIPHNFSSSSVTSTSASVHNSEAQSYNHFKGKHAHLEAQAAATLSSTASMDAHRQERQLVDELGLDGIDCVNMLENFGCMELLDTNELIFLSSILNNTETPLDGGTEEDQDISPGETHQFKEQKMQENGSPSSKNDKCSLFGVSGFKDDLAEVFFEWLKSNKGVVSAEDLRKVKIKKSTVENAARRLGGGREAMKQLLRLILEWVKSNIKKKRTRDVSAEGSLQFPYNSSSREPPCVVNTNVNFSSVQPDSGPCVPESQWLTWQPYAADPPSVKSPAVQPVGYVRDPYSNGQQPAEYQMPDNDFPPLTSTSPQVLAGYGCRPNGENGLVRLGSSATKEARQKRMARQRRLMSHHLQQNQQSQQHNLPPDQHGLFGSDNCTVLPPQTNHENCMYWQPVPAVMSNAPQVITIDAAQATEAGHCYQRQTVGQERRQKSQKNLKFLLQKVLKQSDVGSLGRIVLPKKEAEANFPVLDARDGIDITMEDIGTSRVWNMRYRFWPNNKSRMYLLENTGDFVSANDLQEGDFIVIYLNLKYNKYMIRGVKVRSRVNTEDNRRAGKAQKTQN